MGLIMPSSQQKTGYSQSLIKVAANAVTVLVTIVISMTGFWMMIGRDFVTRDESRVLISTQIEKIDVDIKNHSEILRKINDTIQKNTDTIINLKLSLTSLSSLAAMEKRMDFLETEIKTVREEQIKRTESINTVYDLEKELKSLREEVIKMNQNITYLRNKADG